MVISLSLFDLTFRSVNLIYLTLSGSFEATDARVEPWARSSCNADEMVPGMRTVTCFERECQVCARRISAGLCHLVQGPDCVRVLSRHAWLETFGFVVRYCCTFPCSKPLSVRLIRH